MPILIFTTGIETFSAGYNFLSFSMGTITFSFTQAGPDTHCSFPLTLSSTVTTQMTFTSNLLDNFTRAPSYYAHEQP